MTILLKTFQIYEQIYTSKTSTIFRGIKLHEHKPVILKHLNKEYPTEYELSRFTREHRITRNLYGDKINQTYGLEKHLNSLVMINEDFGGDALSLLLPKLKSDLKTKLALAIQIAEALGQIHSQSIIHKDINPSNIVWNHRTNRVKIIDFGIASELSRENPEIRHPNILEGTINYISPEQTGRMNRSMDYRSDLYSLGITLYELFTGKLPFYASDAMGMIHNHMAVIPEPPSHITPEIPAPLSDIIMRLIAKTPEERYQSSTGVKKDLGSFLSCLVSGQSLSSFEIGTNDVSGLFQIPQKLYGREKDVETLLSAFARVSSGAKEIMLVAGYSGIGKSALVHELYKPVVGNRGFFISGKFDQYKRNIPYSALIQAFQDLVKNLLAEDNDRLLEWKQKLTNALGPSGQVVVDVIPEIELIIGEQPPIQELDPDQTRNRFHIVFQNFFRVFADKDHPLTLFIDDLQWADLPSLQLIGQFMSEVDTNHLLIIGAYRDNEVDAAHFLLESINAMKRNGAIIHTITLTPLDLVHVNYLIADVMSCSLDQAAGLARICHEKTLGNPFFLYQLLHTFYEEKSLYFEPGKGIWMFDAEAIKHANITENVVDLMAGKILRLKQDTQDILKLAACIGNTFDLSTLSMVYGKSKIIAAGLLFETMKENLVIPMDDRYRFVSDSQETLNVAYRFLHDRIQQAAYSLIDDVEKKKIHLKIGQLFLKNIPSEERGEKIFDMVNHLDLGASLITESFKKDHLAELNLLAGQKAKQTAAFKPACEYFRKGIDLAGHDGWEKCYSRMLTLHTEAMEAHYLNVNYPESENLFRIIVKHATTALDKVKAYEIRILTLLSESRFKDAMDAGFEILRQLGFHFPKNPRIWHIIAGLIHIKLTLKRTSNSAILSAHPMKDLRALAGASLLHKLTSTTLFSKPELYPLVIFKRVRLSLQYGEAPMFSFSAYASLGLIFCSIGKIEEGYRLGKLGEALFIKSAVKKEKTRILLIINMFISHCKNHLRDTLKPLEAAFESRLETGDIEYASHAVSAYCLHIFLSGVPLKQVDQEQTHYLKSIRLLEQKFDVDNISNFHQTTLNLMDSTKPLDEYSGTSFDEKTMLPVLHREENRTALFAYHLYKLYLNYLAGEYDKAAEQIPHAGKYITAVRSLFVVPIFNLYESLTRLALCKKTTGKIRKTHLKIVKLNQKKMKAWATHAPMNHLHKWHLVEAEKAQVLRQVEKAKYHYKQAIAGAKQNDYLQEEALSNECYAEFLLNQGDEDFAGLIMRKALYAYSLWGAEAKVVQLNKTWPQLLSHQDPVFHLKSGKAVELSNSSTKTTSSEALDMATIMKASRMISREIVLSKLIEKILIIAMENAGAQKGFVILEQNGQYCIEGEATLGSDSIEVLKSIPVENHGGLSSHIVNYVARTKRILILDDATVEGDFTDDPYVVKNRPRSIICSAILYQGNITAILYMENNLSKAAFRLERMELLNALASQAAISINNARLYENLEEKVDERTNELNITLRKVEEANENIMKSIRYSSVIQKSLLPDMKTTSDILPESFFIWKPRDIVGGDIYVCEKVDRGIVIALIDCTGHGIPGAFMTMLASSGLRRIIREDKLFQPADILKSLNHIIKTSLQQDTEHAKSDDGLDAAICCFDEQERVLYFSGARMPLHIIDKGELTVIKGDRMSIGYVASDLNYKFSTHVIENKNLAKRFYMATDGYTDQLGGKDRIRFGSVAFKELLLSNQMSSFKKQGEILKAAFELHRKTHDRTDDMTVAGFKFV